MAKGHTVRCIIFIAISCVAVLLAACSGIGTPSSGAPTPSEPANGGGAVGGDYDSARTAVQSVLAEIAAIEGLPVDTAAQREAARARAAAARMRFDRAIADLRSATAGLAAGSQARAAADSYLRGITLADIPARLAAAESGAAEKWASGLDGPSRASVANPLPSAVFERFPRAQADGTVIPDSGRLGVRTEPVMHSAGKTVFSPQGAGVTDELPMRSLTVRSAHAVGKTIYPYRWDDSEWWGDWALQGRDGTPPLYGGSAEYDASEYPTQLSYTDGILEYSVQITPGGLVYKARGNAIFNDFQRRFDIGDTTHNTDWWYGYGPDGVPGTADDGTFDLRTLAASGNYNANQDRLAPAGANNGCLNARVPGATADCTNWNHDDVKLTFGSPSQPLNGVTAFYWRTRVPFPEGTSRDDPNIVAKLRGHDQHYPDDDLGSYELWISNYSGIDRGLEPGGGRAAPSHPGDDEERRLLEYAAYGLFTYTDMLHATRAPARQQAFHFGYDTFADRAGQRTTDIGAADTVEATFRGRTMAYQYLLYRDTRPGRNDIRGDIVLNARIGSGANTISGEITRVEKRVADGSWAAYEDVVRQNLGAVRDRLVLAGKSFKDQYTVGENSWEHYFDDDYSSYGAEIGADGSYEGGVYLQYWVEGRGWREKGWLFDSFSNGHLNGYNNNPDKEFDISIFGGTIYGPRDGNFENVETAGYWYLVGDSRDANKRWGGIVGSYGAVRTD